jgi:hypothetical protein
MALQEAPCALSVAQVESLFLEEQLELPPEEVQAVARSQEVLEAWEPAAPEKMVRPALAPEKTQHWELLQY